MANTYTVYSADGFQALGTFASLHAAQEAIKEQAYGNFTIESPTGRLWSVPAGGDFGPVVRARQAARQAAPSEAVRSATHRARTSELVGPRRPDGSYYLQKPDGRGGSTDGRRGTGHTHPPGRTRCPKCGV